MHFKFGESLCILSSAVEKCNFGFCVFQDFALKEIQNYGKKPCNSTMDVKLTH